MRKKQDILLKAVECSKYADKIQVYLAGHGPCEKPCVNKVRQ